MKIQVNGDNREYGENCTVAAPMEGELQVPLAPGGRGRGGAVPRTGSRACCERTADDAGLRSGWVRDRGDRY